MNIIDAIINIINENEWRVKTSKNTSNRINAVGEALEEYVKDAFAGTFSIDDEILRDKKMSDCFSYLGNQNNPPDIILKNGDAIEVKKFKLITPS